MSDSPFDPERMRRRELEQLDRLHARVQQLERAISVALNPPPGMHADTQLGFMRGALFTTTVDLKPDDQDYANRAAQGDENWIVPPPNPDPEAEEPAPAAYYGPEWFCTYDPAVSRVSIRDPDGNWRAYYDDSDAAKGLSYENRDAYWRDKKRCDIPKAVYDEAADLHRRRGVEEPAPARPSSYPPAEEPLS